MRAVKMAPKSKMADKQVLLIQGSQYYLMRAVMIAPKSKMADKQVLLIQGSQ
jgi:hypothetical protein